MPAFLLVRETRFLLIDAMGTTLRKADFAHRLCVTGAGLASVVQINHHPKVPVSLDLARAKPP